MKALITITASLLTLVPSISSADGRWHGPVHSDRGSNPWPFIAGAVIGGIIVHEATKPPVESPPWRNAPVPAEGLVYVNGVLMKRVQTCHQEIVRDSFGDQYVVNKCNYIYVPVE